MDQHSVSRTTVRQALSTLVTDGLLYRIQGKGTYVSPAKIAQPLDTLLGFAEILQQMGLTPQITVLSKGVTVASAEVSQRLRQPVGGQIVRIERRVSVQGAPLFWDHSFLPHTLTSALDGHDHSKEPILRLLEKAGYRLGDAHYTMTARLALSDEATILEIEPFAPVMVIRRTFYGGDGAPLDFSRVVYRCDRYEFEMTLSRK